MKKYDGIKIWVDDIRPVPTGYVGAKSVNEAIALIFLSDCFSYGQSCGKSQYGTDGAAILAVRDLM
ncbi:MAG: hypothetical protein K6B69_16115 [Lachnospiraceae bacterium]|nr:hypothetical protein [Lachnospiraceae bacterium]